MARVSSVAVSSSASSSSSPSSATTTLCVSCGGPPSAGCQRVKRRHELPDLQISHPLDNGFQHLNPSFEVEWADMPIHRATGRVICGLPGVRSMRLLLVARKVTSTGTGNGWVLALFPLCSHCATLHGESELECEWRPDTSVTVNANGLFRNRSTDYLVCSGAKVPCVLRGLPLGCRGVECRAVTWQLPPLVMACAWP
jgi:hypothetical protein